ncbi:MAG TPA: DUF4249 family protein [Prolixibacteraceae bacterium]|nr:DUF4249 family protein [Prolixibacteraceae bacterium]
MRKKLIYFSFILMFFASCEERYTPIIDTIEGQLVVEAMLTNVQSRNFVHLTTTNSFYDSQQPIAVSGASVELIEINGAVIKGFENVPGYFYFNSVPVSGKNYKLQIHLKNDTYESEVVTMPPLPTMTNFYTGHVEKKNYITDGYGVPVAHNIQGREIYADLPVTNSLSYYRFNVRSILEWVYNPPATGPPPPPIYGWQSYYFNSQFNIAGPKKFSQTGNIEKHPLLMLSYKAIDYLNSDTLISSGWILIIEQFGTSKGSFEYHEKLNSQFSADGSLFDPIQTQIYGNISCITDPSKIVFGYFDMNSYKQYRYYYNMNGPQSVLTLREIFRYPEITDDGEITGWPPTWWER